MGNPTEAPQPGTTPIDMSLVVQNLGVASRGLDQGHDDAVRDIFEQEKGNLGTLLEDRPEDPLWRITLEHMMDCMDLLIEMMEAEAQINWVHWVLNDTIRHAINTGAAEGDD